MIHSDEFVPAPPPTSLGYSWLLTAAVLGFIGSGVFTFLTVWNNIGWLPLCVGWVFLTGCYFGSWMSIKVYNL